jgi:hypothetical protein
MLYYLLCITFVFFFYHQRVSLQASFFTFLTILGSYTKRKQELYRQYTFRFTLSFHCSSHIWSQNLSNKFSLDSFCLDADTNLVNKKKIIP